MNSSNAEPAGNSQSKANIFISYSRKDQEFADRLDAALRARGFSTLIDRSDIYAFEDWWRRIQGLIAQADAIVFVISPDAVASEVCQREVRFAASLNKRLAPLVHRRADREAIPDELARLNFIYFDRDAVFDDAFARLCEALETDIAWVRKHTELTGIAERWRSARPVAARSTLLRGSALAEAEEWIASRPRGAPEATDNIRSFLVASRREVARRRTFMTVALGIGLAVTSALAGVAYWQRTVAVEQKQTAVSQRDEALRAQSRFLANLSATKLSAGDVQTAMALALEALPNDPQAADRPYVAEAEGSLRAAFQSAAALDFAIGLTKSLTDGLATAQLSPDGKLFAALSGTAVHLWNAETGDELGPIATPSGRVWGVDFSPDGRLLILAGDDGVRLWNISEKRVKADKTNTAGGRICGWQFFLDTAELATFQTELTDDAAFRFKMSDSTNNSITLVATKGCNVPALTSLSATIFRHVRISEARSIKGNLQMVVLNDSNQLSMMSLPGGRTGQVSDEKFMLATLSPDGRQVAAINSGGKVAIWDAVNVIRLATVPSSVTNAVAMGFSEDNQHLLIATADGRVRIWARRSAGDLNAVELIEAARGALTTCIPPSERKAFFLSAAPPDWCVKLEKPPYTGTAWQRWLAAKRRGDLVQLPSDEVN